MRTASEERTMSKRASVWSLCSALHRESVEGERAIAILARLVARLIFGSCSLICWLLWRRSTVPDRRLCPFCR